MKLTFHRWDRCRPSKNSWLTTVKTSSRGKPAHYPQFSGYIFYNIGPQSPQVSETAQIFPQLISGKVWHEPSLDSRYKGNLIYSSLTISWYFPGGTELLKWNLKRSEIRRHFKACNCESCHRPVATKVFIGGIASATADNFRECGRAIARSLVS